jgi:hypothetical protein
MSKHQRPYLRLLWEGESKIARRQHREVFLKKAMDGVCMQADLMETTLDYAFELCQGMDSLFKLGASYHALKGHHILMQKLITLGRDLMDTSETESDSFYLGVFLELKLMQQWKQKGFFKLVTSLIDRIRLKGAVFSNKIKKKLQRLLNVQQPAMYRFYFNQAA